MLDEAYYLLCSNNFDNANAVWHMEHAQSREIVSGAHGSLKQLHGAPCASQLDEADAAQLLDSAGTALASSSGPAAARASDALMPYYCYTVAFAAAKIVAETFPGAYNLQVEELPDIDSEELGVVVAIFLSLNKPRGRPRLRK